MKLRAIVLLTVSALPIAFAGCTNSASEIRARYGDSTWTADELISTPYDRAKAHYEAGRFGLAVKQFEIALSDDPKSVAALNGLAASFDRLHRFELAERYYLRALNVAPDDAQTLNNLGYSYLIQGRYDLALAHLQDAYRRDPMNALVRDNLQQAEASLELESRDFLASAVGSAEFRDVMAPPRTVNLQTGRGEDATPGAGKARSEVQIEALGEADGIWVERSSASVQRLITQPNPDLLLAMREAGLAPRLANFRNQSAVTALQTQPAPWQTTHQVIAEAMVERDLAGAIGRDQLLGDETPAAPTATVEMAELPWLSARLFETDSQPALSDLPQLAAAVIEDGAGSRRPAGAAADGSNGGVAHDGAMWDLPQLSAAVIEAASPGEDETPAVADEAAGEGAHPARQDARRDAWRNDRPTDRPAPPPGKSESPVIEVSNGAGRSQMALRISQFLDSQGVSAKRLTNAAHFRHQDTVIFYRREWLREAQKLAAFMPIEVRLEAAPEQKPDIRIRLGGDLLNFDQGLFYASRESSAKPRG